MADEKVSASFEDLQPSSQNYSSGEDFEPKEYGQNPSHFYKKDSDTLTPIEYFGNIYPGPDKNFTDDDEMELGVRLLKQQHQIGECGVGFYSQDEADSYISPYNSHHRTMIKCGEHELECGECEKCTGENHDPTTSISTLYKRLVEIAVNKISQRQNQTRAAQIVQAEASDLQLRCTRDLKPQPKQSHHKTPRKRTPKQTQTTSARRPMTCCAKERKRK